jgi:hypothetical protein
MCAVFAPSPDAAGAVSAGFARRSVPNKHRAITTPETFMTEIRLAQ